MENHATFSELHELLKVAKFLRKAATETDDRKYKMLFIHAAASLLVQAKKRAFVSHDIFVPRDGQHLPDSTAGLN
jgi:hypothetical protein